MVTENLEENKQKGEIITNTTRITREIGKWKFVLFTKSNNNKNLRKLNEIS